MNVEDVTEENSCMFLSLQRKNGLIGTLSEGGEFPLHFSAKVKDSVLAERLITVNCESIEFLNRKLILNPLIKQLDPTLSRYEGMRPLQIAACESKDFKIFQMILATGKVDPNLPIYQSYNPRKEKRSQLKLLEVIFEMITNSNHFFKDKEKELTSEIEKYLKEKTALI